jgi:hypothetical protein
LKELAAKNFAKPGYKGWYGFDLDGTLAEYYGWVDADNIGPPIHAMVKRVKTLLALGEEIRIFTARAWHDGTKEMFDRSEIARTAIQRWCVQHIGKELPITCVKDLNMIALYDDRCIQVEANTGRLLTVGAWEDPNHGWLFDGDMEEAE